MVQLKGVADLPPFRSRDAAAGDPSDALPTGVAVAGAATLASERAYDAIREMIVTGEYRPGDRLRESDLSERAGVSRTPVREALRRLIAEGLIDFLPNRGAFVATWDDEHLIDIFEVRAVIEGYACKRAATRIEPEEIDRLTDLADQMEARYRGTAVDLFQITQLNNEFHNLLVNASRSRILVNSVEGVLRVALVHRTFLRFSDADMHRSFRHHREIIDAVRAGDGDWAQSVMCSHIHAARDIIMHTGADPSRGAPGR